MDTGWDDTIAAVASPLGCGARGILRVTGPDAWQAVIRVAEFPIDSEAPPLSEPFVRPALLKVKNIRQPWPATILYWPGQRSYTGQVCAEIHTIGSPVLLQACLAEMMVRQARPGEFTLRAFLAGRIDLSQAEAVAAVVAAGNDGELAAALRQLAGGIASPIRRLREELLDLLVELEAGLDFADEDLTFISRSDVEQRLRHARDQLQNLLGGLHARSDAREGHRVVLLGRPNVGKSSLFNALLEGERAIVADLPGTTRDCLAAETEWQGTPILLIDTAGVEDFSMSAEPRPLPAAFKRDGSPDDGSSEANPLPPDIAARRFSENAAQSADLLLFCTDCRSVVSQAERAFVTGVRSRCLLVATKCDLTEGWAFPPGIQPDVLTSAATGEGIQFLRNQIVSFLSQHASSRPMILSVASATRRCLDLALSALDEALALATDSLADEYLSASLRAALESLGEIVGAVYTEDILDRVFSRFCIGK